MALSGLQRPPKPRRRGSTFARGLVLILMIVASGLLVWTAVTNQRIDLIEDVALDDLALPSPVEVGGLTINVVENAGGPVPVVILHDVDPAGIALLDHVAATVPDRFRAVRIDLPGFGLSSRIVEPGTGHTVGSMAATIVEVIEERFDIPVVIVGIGLGGEVGAEIAVIRPELVRGLVMVDVDFWLEDGWVGFVERFPWLGRAATYTLDTSGRFGADRWAPECGEGGWCPNSEEVAARATALSISGTTDSFRAFRQTPASSLVPSDLDQIQVPVAIVWSKGGGVPEESIDRLVEEMPDARVIRVDAWKAHLQFPSSVAEAIQSVGE